MISDYYKRAFINLLNFSIENAKKATDVVMAEKMTQEYKMLQALIADGRHLSSDDYAQLFLASLLAHKNAENNVKELLKLIQLYDQDLIPKLKEAMDISVPIDKIENLFSKDP